MEKATSLDWSHRDLLGPSFRKVKKKKKKQKRYFQKNMKTDFLYYFSSTLIKWLKVRRCCFSSTAEGKRILPPWALRRSWNFVVCLASLTMIKGPCCINMFLPRVRCTESIFSLGPFMKHHYPLMQFSACMDRIKVKIERKNCA